MPKETRQRELYDQGKTLADIMWEDAVKLAQILAPETPTNAEELPEVDQLLLLERVAMELPVFDWDQPEAIEALFHLKQKIRGQSLPYLRDEAARQRRMRHNRPDPRISPANPEFAKMSERMGVS